MPVTLEKLQRDMYNFPYELQMYCYHHLNGRLEEADTYLEAYKDMQNKIVEELQVNRNLKDDEEGKKPRKKEKNSTV